MEKVTKRTMFEAIKVKVADDKDMVAFIDHELELLAKKNSYKSDKPTANQIANAGIKEQIASVLKAEPTRLFTVSELCTAVGVSSNQKCSALVNQMVRDGLAEKVVDKRKSYFKA